MFAIKAAANGKSIQYHYWKTLCRVAHLPAVQISNLSSIWHDAHENSNSLSPPSRTLHIIQIEFLFNI
jgi:hypothetical protein